VVGVQALRRKPPAAVVPVRFVVNPDSAAPPIFNGTWSVVPSPDGRAVLYSVAYQGNPQLFIRRLDQLESHPIPGTERATQPVFSPDSKWVAFLADGKLKKVSLDGGSP